MTIAATQINENCCISNASRVSTEQNVTLGTKVGFSIPFEKNYAGYSGIVYMTNEMLLDELCTDPLLSCYSIIIIDDVHERTIFQDVLLGATKKILKKRPEFRVILTSVVLDVDVFENFFNSNLSSPICSVISLETRSYPVNEYFLKDCCSDYISEIVEVVLKIHQNEGPGDILVFAPGKEEVETILSLISDRSINNRVQLVALPLYSNLNVEDQLRAIAPGPPNSRKVVVATSIAESNVTIDGVVFVVDSGYTKLRVFDCDQSIDVFISIPTSKANEYQRLERAGRTKPGKCYRMYSQEETKASYSVSEIHRSDLTRLILILKSIGVENVFHFNYIEVPPRQLLESAIDTLMGLEFLDTSGKILNFVHGIPLHPLLQKFLISSENFNCSEEVITIISMLKEDSLFISSGKPAFIVHDAMKKVFISLHQFAVEEGDWVSLVNIYQSFLQSKKSPSWCNTNCIDIKALYRVSNYRQKLLKSARRLHIPIKSCGTNVELLCKCIISVFFKQVAKVNPNGSYSSLELLNSMELFLDRNSVVFESYPQYVIYHKGLKMLK